MPKALVFAQKSLVVECLMSTHINSLQGNLSHYAKGFLNVSQFKYLTNQKLINLTIFLYLSFCENFDTRFVLRSIG